MLNSMLELIFKAKDMINLLNPSDQLQVMEMAINHNDVMRKQNVLTRIYSGEEQVVGFKSGLVIHSYPLDDNQG